MNDEIFESMPRKKAQQANKPPTKMKSNWANGYFCITMVAIKEIGRQMILITSDVYLVEMNQINYTFQVKR